MTEGDIPKSWSKTTGKKSDDVTRLSRYQDLHEADARVPGSGSTSKTVKQRKGSRTEKFDLERQSQVAESANKGSGKLPRWTKSWLLWASLLAIVPSAIAVVATLMLLKSPSAPNCPAIFWPLASASVRLHCAQLAASKQTVNDLLQAIALVKQLPESHPLRAEVDRFLAEWSQDILKLADQTFQAGQLGEAIATAKRIPNDMAAYKLASERIDKWQSIWSKGEGIYKEAEDSMRNERWQQAFMTASRLLRLDNKFWETNKYQQLNNLITKSREDDDKLIKAEDLAKGGSIDNLLKSIKLAESIGVDSYMYQKAQSAIPLFGRQMLDMAQKKLDNRDADGAISIAQQIPANAGLQLETEDFIAIAEAERNAWVGTVSGLEAAIAQAQQIKSERPVYQKAQQLIARWQLEIQDVARLEKARSLASQGTVVDLTAAIAEAQLVPVNNPRAREARQEIWRWVGQIQTIEDRPFMDRAEQYALIEDVNSLQAAISEASRIRHGRALYPEARKKIGAWTATIERIQDQPYLDRARELAGSGDLPGAIQTARQIPGNRSLSGEAEAAIADWSGQITARENWNKAREIALRGTVRSLSEAIRLANRVPESSPLRNDVNPAIDQWSQQLLDIARSQSQSNLERAIETARLVPSSTSAYSSARDQIRAWQELLAPPAPQPTQQPQDFSTPIPQATPN